MRLYSKYAFTPLMLLFALFVERDLSVPNKKINQPQTISLKSNPILSVTDGQEFCTTDEAITITANPHGGYFSGSVIGADGSFDPSSVAEGTYSITYHPNQTKHTKSLRFSEGKL